jgi:hypothetical protein
MTDELDERISNLVEMIRRGRMLDEGSKVPADQAGISRKEAEQSIQAIIERECNRARIEEVKTALSYTTMRELENRYYYLVDRDGGTPVKLKVMSKAEIAELQSNTDGGEK